LRSDQAAARKDEARKRATREQIGVLERVFEQASKNIPLLLFYYYYYLVFIIFYFLLIMTVPLMSLALS
jgi:hypothetical protein